MDVACAGIMMTINQLTILDPNGHSTTGWNPQDAPGVERARRLCEALLRRGYRAFGMERDGECRVLEQFDPRERETLLVPPIRGG